MSSLRGSMVTMATNGLPQPQRVHPNFIEYGREYVGFRKGQYLFPVDEDEKDRMDLYHKLIYEIARRGQLYSAPIELGNIPSARVMDLGCGTGIWAIDMADQFPNAEVIGIDLVNIQPPRIPPNLRFELQRDYEAAHWGLGEDSFDLIHLQQSCGSVSSYPSLYQKIYRHLVPGSGYFEQVEIDLEPRCDDHTLDPHGGLKTWYGNIMAATAHSRPINYQHNTRAMLDQAGFTDIQETVIRAPYNTWPADTRQREVGAWYRLGITDGLEALTLAPILKAWPNWNQQHVNHIVGLARQEIVDRKIHAYNNIHIWTARRPQQ